MVAAITLDRSKAPAGTSVHVGVTGTGFIASGIVTVTVGGVAVPFDNGGVVSGTGTFSDTVNVAQGSGPASVVGALTVSVTDGTNTATGTVTTSVWQTAEPKEIQESNSKTAFGTP
jgi:hypothetical protein